MPEKYDINGNPIGLFSVDEGVRYVDPTIIQPAVVSANRKYWEAEKWARENVRDPREEAAPYVAAGLAGTMAAPFALDVMTSGPALAKGLEWVGEKMMPSSLLKGISYYMPKAAGTIGAVSPWLDAGALSYWSAQGLSNAGKRWLSDKSIDKAAAIAEGAVSALPFAAPMLGAFKEVPKMGREFGKWYDFVVRGNTSPYHKLGIKQKMLNRQADDIIGDWNVNDYTGRLRSGMLIEGQLPYYRKVKQTPMMQGVRKPQTSSVLFRAPGGDASLSMNLEDIGIAGEVQKEIEYHVPGKHPLFRAGILKSAPIGSGSIELNVGAFPRKYIAFSDDAFRFDGYKRSSEHIPYPWTIDASTPVESLLVQEGGISGQANMALGWTRGSEVANSRNTSLMIQGASEKDYNHIKKHFDGLRSVMGNDGVLSGSGTMYERGILSGVPADTEIITTESRLPALERKLKFTRSGNNAFDVRGKSDLAHGNKDVDIQVIKENSHGSATGDLAWSLFRTMYPEEFQRQAQASIKYSKHYTDMGIYDPTSRVPGKPYTPEKMLDDFNSGNWSLQNTINDALSIMKDIKSRNGGSMDQLLKHNRPMSLLTNQDPEVQSMVHKAIDTIGKSQIGGGYVNGSDWYPNINFGDVAENEKFLTKLGIDKKFAKDPGIMKNIFDYWYMQTSIQKRGVKGANGIQEALDWTMRGNHPRTGGDMSGAGRNTVASTASRMPFSSEQVGASQTHLHDRSVASQMKSTDWVHGRYETLKSDAEVVGHKLVKEQWKKDEGAFMLGIDQNDVSNVSEKVSDFFKKEPKTIKDLSDNLVSLSRRLLYDGASHDTVDIVIDKLSELYDVPMTFMPGYNGDYRGVLRAGSDAGGVRYFDFYSAMNPEIRPYEFGRPVEKYAEETSSGMHRTLNPIEYEDEIRDVMEESRELARRLQVPLVDGPGVVDRRPLFGELKQQYGATAIDYRKEIQDIAQKALDNRNEREVTSAKIDEIERMPGAKARLRREEQLVKDAFFGKFSESVLRDMKADKIGEKELKSILQNLAPSADWHGPSDELKNISADEIVRVMRNSAGNIVITRRTPSILDARGFKDNDYEIIRTPYGWVFEDPNLPFANGGLLSRLRAHYGSDDKVLEVVRKFAGGGPKKNALIERINGTSKADFVKRLQDPNRMSMNYGDSVATHRMAYATDDKNNAIVYPEVQSVGDTLQWFRGRSALDRAIERGDTLMMSVPEAEWFTKNYKAYYPAFTYGDFLKDYRTGGKIRIKPENRGKFTALKKRTGHSASWFKAHGTPAQKKMAVFALNARKWKHGDGGFLRNDFAVGGDKDEKPYNIFEDERAFGKRDAHLKSLDTFIKANPTVAGLDTATFRDVLSAFAGLESAYNEKAANKSGYSGYYGLKGGAGLNADAQHRAAYQHLAKLFRDSMTDDDLLKGEEMGFTPAQILYKYWNQGNNATEYLQTGGANVIGNNPELESLGNQIRVDVDYSNYLPKAYTQPYYVVKPGDTFFNIQKRARVYGRHYNKAGQDLKAFNSPEIMKGNLHVGDTVRFAPRTPYELGGIIERLQKAYGDKALDKVREMQAK